ncbi:MAG: cob(I)yrinic acid a,c-diamide adenosyltransferase [Eubacteriales bacterium]|jgi:cob(I)alamin adenosyltransferase|nr:cob(I)yrinic acid a,c-diamide adenosyltransferase [Eubacteriales bacterium]MDD4104299.1 cob(I)yrinic acid a,c-diamide adenosyltransferase [Eubacteriales bacterium]MDD4709754.1 cob(I)yrinic acid a,c-diamide adenosyltransferase [Eubacteriales bacterium]NLO14886.1 cob(I)yrinic acid a,c-diamide adenosyltransferase [Clostridiales bacterium]
MPNLLHVYTGDGKGKSTAAMGLATRMLGYDKQVLIIQFMKQGNSGELKSLKKLGATVYPAPSMNKFTYQMDEEEIEKTAQDMRDAISDMVIQVRKLQPALTVLDELAVAMAYRMVPKDDGFRLIDAALESGDVVVTGRGASPELIEKAAYVSIITPQKHPFDDGIAARKGIEW